MPFSLATNPSLAAFGASFTAITLAELGDKTFFMALILATRHRAAMCSLVPSRPWRR
jgi:hypothetical protein